jgi:hypothetical protein
MHAENVIKGDWVKNMVKEPALAFLKLVLLTIFKV